MPAPFKLLLIDDDDAQVRMLTRVIERHFGERVAVFATSDSQTARQWLEAHRPDVVVTDLEMPAVSGLEVLRMVKRSHPVAQVVLFTGHSSTYTLFDALEFGASEYLLKPLDQEELVKVLEECCEHVDRWQRAMLETFRSSRPADELNASLSR